MKAPLTLLLTVGLGGGCAWNAAGTTGCQANGSAHGLPPALVESSGVAFSRAMAGVLWSHNDGGHDPTLFALSATGRLLGELPLQNAANQDWEDIATGPCAQGACIYVADVGDNQEARGHIALYRVTDPGLPDGTPARAEAFLMRLPEGPKDIEAFFMAPGEDAYFISKGNGSPVTVFRYSGPLRSGETVVLEEVQTLSDKGVPLPAQVTGADVSPDGTLVVVRTYSSLQFFRRGGDGRLSPISGAEAELRTLHEVQGEGIGLGPDGLVALTSEGGSFGGSPSIRLLTCALKGRP